MVDKQSKNLERQSNYNAVPRSDDRNRCINEGVGGPLQWGHDSGNVELLRAENAHKLSRIKSGNFCSESIHKNIEIQTCPPSSRQYYNSGSNKQNGGHKVKSSATDNTTVVGLLSTEHDHSYCRTLTRGTECDRRQGVESIPRFEQLGVEQTNFSPDRRVLGSHRGGSICGQIDRTKPQICQLETRSRSTGSRCSDVKLGSHSGVCLPSILPNRQVLGENKERSSISDSRHSSVAKPAMVLANTDTVDRPSNFIATNERVVEVASRGNSSAINNRAISVSGMETLRQRFKTEGFSEESADLLLESHERAPRWLTQAPGQNGVAGAVNGKLIHFKPLWDK